MITGEELREIILTSGMANARVQLPNGVDIAGVEIQTRYSVGINSRRGPMETVIILKPYTGTEA